MDKLCKDEWTQVLSVAAQKNAVEESVRRFRSGEKESQEGTKEMTTVAEVVQELLDGSEADSICKIWAQCIWSNAIDLVKIESAQSWLNRRKQEWTRIGEETGIIGDSDAFCKRFTASEQNNIRLFEDIRELVVERKLALEGALDIEYARECDSQSLVCHSSSTVEKLNKRIEMCQRQLSLTLQDRQEAVCMLEQLKQRLSQLIVHDLPFPEADVNSQSLTDMLEIVEKWIKVALIEHYGPLEVFTNSFYGNGDDDQLGLVHADVPDIEGMSAILSDDDVP